MMRGRANMGQIKSLFQRIFDFLFGRKPEVQKYNFLIVCTGNTCRSPMAQRILEQIRQVNIVEGKYIGNIESAGTSVTERKASDQAIEVMRMFYGTNISGHVPQQLSQEVVDRADIILTMDVSKATIIRNKFEIGNRRVLMMSTFGNSSGPVDDPYGGSCERYLDTAIQMEAYLARGMRKLVAEKCGDRPVGS